MRASRAMIVVGICLLATATIGSTGVATATPGHDAGPPTPAPTPEPATSAGQTLQGGHVDACADRPPANLSDPNASTADVVGWVDGYWYNESVEIANRSAMTEAELANLTARTAARVEALRCLTFQELPPLRPMTREEWRSTVESGFEREFNASDRRFTRARLATLLYAGQSEDPADVLIEHRTGFPAAFYDTQQEYMGFIAADPARLEVDEVTLAHELTHVIQDQHFQVEAVFREPTSDAYMSSLAIVEGDAGLVERQYENNCGTWVDECHRMTASPPEPAYWGLTIQDLAAYNTPLVAQVYASEGWGGVNDLLADPPDSMVPVIQPEDERNFQRESLVVIDRSGADWRRVETDEGEYDIVGQHGLTAMLVAPTYETQDQADPVEVISLDPFLRSHEGGRLNYNHPVTEGWRNDRLYAYTNERGEIGSLWTIKWETDQQASTFVQAYRDLLEYRGARASEAADSVYEFNQDSNFQMSVAIRQRDQRVTIVTAPSTDELAAVHQGIDTGVNGERDLEERVAKLETDVNQLETQLDRREARIRELEQEQRELERFKARVNALLEDGDYEDLDELRERLEELENESQRPEQPTNRTRTDANTSEAPGDDEEPVDAPLPGFGVGLATTAILVALIARRYRRRP